MDQDTRPRILFYTHSARAFISSLIGHLYEIVQEYPVILLTESLHEGYADLLRDRQRFPKLERVETVNGLGFSLRTLLWSNRRWHRLARNMIRQTQPTLVVTENDMSSLFDMYLLREAKKSGAKCLTIQAMSQPADVEMQKFMELRHIYREGVCVSGLKRNFRVIGNRSRKRMGHYLVHYLLPWLAGERGLRGRSSYVLRKGASGLRDSDLNLVPTPLDFRTHVAMGISAKRLAVLPHPLLRVPHRLYFVDPEDAQPSAQLNGQESILVLLPSEPLGFHRHDYALIGREQRRQTRLAIIHLLCEQFPTWRVIVKPHPDCGTLEEVRDYLGAVVEAVTVVSPSMPVEPYLKVCDVILDLPLSNTTALFTAACACPDKPIISANVDDEFYGDHYKNFPGVDYVDSMQELEALLHTIRAGTYQKKAVVEYPTGEGCREFAKTGDAIRYLLRGGD